LIAVSVPLAPPPMIATVGVEVGVGGAASVVTQPPYPR
jgi:hypothetical protein